MKLSMLTIKLLLINKYSFFADTYMIFFQLTLTIVHTTRIEHAHMCISSFDLSEQPHKQNDKKVKRKRRRNSKCQHMFNNPLTEFQFQFFVLTILLRFRLSSITVSYQMITLFASKRTNLTMAFA